MPFALDSNPETSEISDAINYLLANYGPNLTADPSTGQITGPQGIVIGYLYRYLSVKYADSFNGAVNFSNSPTNRQYYGVNNSNSTTESTNPADYIWYKAAGGFGTTKFLFYQTIGGRGINFFVGTTAPDYTYVKDSGSAIDLDVITAGTQGNSATTAYLVQSQSSPAPTGFPLTTSGTSLPPGFSATLGTVAVGQVAWYTFGRYNASSVTVDGIPPNSTYWSVPIAASIFQDIRSDNWNGATPPTFGNPSTYGTTGYYIQRNTGDVFFNNGIYRGDISTDGDAYFEGKTKTTTLIPAFNLYADYSSYSYAITSTTGTTLRVGTIGRSNATTSYANIGVLGEASDTTKGWGVIGIGGWIGGGFYGNSSGSTALQANAYSSTATALDVVTGRMKMQNNTMVSNLNSQYSNILLGSIAGNSMQLVQSPVSGTGTATFSGTTKPGGNSTNVWVQLTINSTTVYLPVWT